jgi:hypothetical protein
MASISIGDSSSSGSNGGVILFNAAEVRRTPAGTPVLQAEEKIILTEPNTELIFAPEQSEGNGTLFVGSK